MSHVALPHDDDNTELYGSSYPQSAYVVILTFIGSISCWYRKCHILATITPFMALLILLCLSASLSHLQCKMDLIKYQLFLLLLLTSCQLHAAQLDSSNSCSTNFFLLEKSLLHSTDNRFNLLKAFYPPREARPVLVKVNYTFTNTSDNVSQIWFWSESEFYLIQPLEIFQFTSLLFSNMPYRRADLSIQLPSECNLASEEYLQLLTTRVRELVHAGVGVGVGG